MGCKQVAVIIILFSLKLHHEDAVAKVGTFVHADCWIVKHHRIISCFRAWGLPSRPRTIRHVPPSTPLGKSNDEMRGISGTFITRHACKGDASLRILAIRRTKIAFARCRYVIIAWRRLDPSPSTQVATRRDWPKPHLSRVR